MRVLLVAPTIDGGDVGESWVAFQWASRLSQHHDLTVLTYHKRGHRTAKSQLPGARVVEWAEPPLLSKAERFNSLLKPGYVPFYVKARRWIRAALARGERFDVAHQPVPVAMRYPSPAAGLGIPLVIGPVGGGLPDPPGYPSDDTAPWYVKLRGLDQARLRHDRLLRKTYQSADCVLGIASYVRDLLSDVPTRRFEVMSETALAELPGSIPERSATDGPIRLLYVGRLIRSKGARDLIGALQYLADIDVVVDIVGGGFDESACRSLADQLGVATRVSFHGAVPRREVDDFYRRADIFVFPSFREPGGNVAFEAMGFGLPLIVSDRGGPGAAVDDSCGIRIPVNSPAQYQRDIASAVRRLVAEPDLRVGMGKAALERVRSIGLWDSKIVAAGQLYELIRGHKD